jgi:hypothetical protein
VLLDRRDVRPDGLPLEYAATDSPDATPLRTISGVALPDGVDVDAQGNIYVANSLAGVSEYAPGPSGPATPLATISGAATGVSGPTAVAVAPPLVVRTSKLAAARAGRPYRVRLHAVLGTTPYLWTLAHGSLPPGLRLHSDGTLSGRPTGAERTVHRPRSRRLAPNDDCQPPPRTRRAQEPLKSPSETTNTRGSDAPLLDSSRPCGPEAPAALTAVSGVTPAPHARPT